MSGKDRDMIEAMEQFADIWEDAPEWGKFTEGEQKQIKGISDNNIDNAIALALEIGYLLGWKDHEAREARS